MPNKDDLIQKILHNLRKLFQVVNVHSKQAERQTGLTGPQLWAIKIIAQGEPLMVSEIARRMCLHPATVVGILDRLEKQKFVTRVRDTEDRRVVRVELTAKGKKLVKKSPQVAQGLLVSGLEKLAHNNLEEISTGLVQMVIILRGQRIPPRLMTLQETGRKKSGPAAARQSNAVRGKKGGRYERIDDGSGTIVR